MGFNPRPRASGRRAVAGARPGDRRVSIRARVRAGDIYRLQVTQGSGGFNPRPRASGRHDDPVVPGRDCEVSIHARVRAGDDALAHVATGAAQFQSTPACERATLRAPPADPGDKFQSTPACERATFGGDLPPERL